MATMAGARSPDPYRKVGAVCVSSDNRILSCGYNGIAAGHSAPPDLFASRESPVRGDLIIHAEQNALMSCQRNYVAKMAVTCSPCKVCANIIAGYGIKEVYFSYEYPREQGYKRIFDFYNIKYGLVKVDDIFSGKIIDMMQIPYISNNGETG